MEQKDLSKSEKNLVCSSEKERERSLKMTEVPDFKVVRDDFEESVKAQNKHSFMRLGLGKISAHLQVGLGKWRGGIDQKNGS